jgi:hypothetical protein
MPSYTFKYKPLYLILSSSLFLGACASFPNQYNGNGAYSYNSDSNQTVHNSELDSLTQSLKNTDNQMALNKTQKRDNVSNLKNSPNSSNSNSSVYASQYANQKNSASNLKDNIDSNSNNNVVITIERPTSMQESNKTNNINNTALSHNNDVDMLVDNRTNASNNVNSFALENSNVNNSNSNVVIEMEPKKQESKMNTFDIVDDTKSHNDLNNVTPYSTSETMLASNFASRTNHAQSNFKVNLDWNDSVDLLFTKLSDKAGYKYATINHPRKNMVVSIHGEGLDFDDILKQAGDQISNCFDVVKIQSEGVFTLKPKGICQIN